MKHLLFVTEKWCDAKPKLSFTNNFHNSFNSFSRSVDNWSFDTLHIDEAALTYKADINEVLIRYCENNKPDLIIFSLLGATPYNPSDNTYRKLREMNIKTCVFWPDTGPSWGMQTIEEINDLVDLHVSWDNPRSNWHDSYPKRNNHISLWTPEDDSLFYPTLEKSIDVSFLGSVNGYRERIAILSTLRESFPDAIISGGQRTSRLTPSAYAELIRNSKIGVNFPISQSGVFYQAKGRIFEYTASNCLLIDIKNPATEGFFKPNEDYIEAFSEKDLMEKIKYYLEHEDERKRIALKGHQTFSEKWTAKIFWETLLSKL